MSPSPVMATPLVGGLIDLMEAFREENWKKFAACHGNLDIPRNDTCELLSKLGNNQELVSVIESVVGESALEWIERKIPALNHGKPVDFTKSETQLNILRAMLMRMPV